MGLSLGHSPWLLIGSVVTAALLSYWVYRRTVPMLSTTWRGTLGSLRFLALALLLFLLMEPVARTVSQTTRPPLLAVVVDDTKSMKVVTGDSTTSVNRARSAVQPTLDHLQQRVKNATTEYYTFDSDLRPLSTRPLDSLSFRGDRTDIAGALEQLSKQAQNDPLSAVVLVSDGQYNTGQTPLRIADQYPVPIHTVTVGDSTGQRDLQVRRVVTNRLAYTDSEVPVQAVLQSNRVDAQTVTVSLYAGDALQTQKKIRLPGGTAEVPVTFTFEPEEPGVMQLSVQADPVPDEAIVENNTRSTTIRIHDRKRRVLLLGAAPSPSFTAVRRVLERDQNTTVTARIPRADGSFYGGTLPDTLSAYDLVVNAGFPSSGVSGREIERVSRTLSEGTPALFFLQSQTDVSAWMNSFDAHLPARPERATLQFRSGTGTTANAGEQHPVLQRELFSSETLDQLPPLTVPAPSWAPTPDAEVLINGHRQDGRQSDPLLITRRRAGQRTALFLGVDPWRWTLLPSSSASADSAWSELVSDLVRWATTDAQDQQVQIHPAASAFDGGESVSFTGQVYDESMSPLSSATVQVELVDTAGTEQQYTMDPAGQGQYSLDVGPLPEGTYKYEASARYSGRSIGRDGGQFSVGALQLETQSPRSNPVLMRQIAERSGASSYVAGETSSLPSALRASSAFSPNVHTSTTEQRLWHRWPFLAVVLGLLVTEWALRKRLGLT